MNLLFTIEFLNFVKDKTQLSDLAEDVDSLTRNADTASKIAPKSATTEAASSHAPFAGSSSSSSNNSNNNNNNVSNSKSGDADRKRLRSIYEDMLPPKELDGKSRMTDQRKAAADK